METGQKLEIVWKQHENDGSWKYHGTSLEMAWKFCGSWKEYGKCVVITWKQHEIEGKFTETGHHIQECDYTINTPHY